MTGYSTLFEGTGKMSSHDASVVDTMQNINGILPVSQIEEEVAYVDFDAVYKDTFDSFNQFSEYQ
ncbi:hypothetical protein [Halobaculum roseum]|uniref:Uncharacterized protein n=1 Tax=Halobaculum roseum TaxID=2175149 RepID=A0ABD5MI80_9EURY|nr:hypothetical protein [Halobaculum roseum]QZY01926.1 hypothetical protein K6T36_11460 [Halobaculum roseum]